MCKECDKKQAIIDNAIKVARSHAASIQDYMQERTLASDEDIKKVIEAEEEELPLLVNAFDEGSHAHRALQKRLKGQQREEILDQETCIEVLSNTEMDYDTYRNLGANDGAVYPTADFLTLLGLLEEASDLFTWQYSN